ncbi:MAG TPA: hypothetical protein DIV44_02265 [Leeuwenhoekiella sp.]|uniref:hypothetical protein n=1 Tax=Leeuwenhoekiella palythoae TaxID=573501 RepID=UPI000C49D813|nr:hypothetical protein [Leeuwenhoekiella palythoae]MAS20256.1 hypothetical protein [Leeuwenhoekiella sp.]MBH13493.1 hypothetical protein [Leeuwenhoekiella sp.]UBZ09808.1 hypothetical protein LDL79_13515 [Leeuwenhoekiella palythoae]HBO29407.1 hypothetical protein [Leeuwenhoekiella sp.]HCQ75606.1 hypothetical protein [Leeuwenhoekiella sp.]|tara:strand:- start:5103 stop:5723 length:621 start_codon:yes stop_codon:yes gene_type:complete
MRKILTLIISGILINSCSSSQGDFTYLDINNNEISKSKFRQKRSTNQYLDIQIDSLNQKKLIERTKTGKLENFEAYRSLVSNKTSVKLDNTKPLVIIYHPGKDACNSSGSATKETLKNWHKTLEDGVQQLKANAPIYLYKEKEGLEKYDGVLNWHKDPDGLTEKLFFKYHYPCSSFVVISSDGEYISYFGEFSKEYVWNAINLISK